MSTFRKQATAVFLAGALGIFCAHSTAYANTTTCEVSWYGPGFHGNTMANGDRYNMNDPETVAHKKLPFGTRLRLTNPQNGNTLEVEVRDRGPYVGKRCLDLSKAGAKLLGILALGIAEIQYQVINRN